MPPLRLSDPASSLDVERAYRLILGRAPESTDALAAKVGISLGDVIDLFIASAEFGHSIAPAIERTASTPPPGRIERPLEPAETTWVQTIVSLRGGNLGTNPTAQDALYALTGVPRPCFSTLALTPGDIVNLYRVVLGREPESNAAVFRWIGEPASATLQSFLQSDEFADRVASPLLLGREPNCALQWGALTGEVAAWAATLPLDAASIAGLQGATRWPQALSALLTTSELTARIDADLLAAIRTWDQRAAAASTGQEALSAMNRRMEAADVGFTYALLLGREVESDEALHARVGLPLHSLMTGILRSPEFNNGVMRPLLVRNRCGVPQHAQLAGHVLRRWAEEVFELSDPPTVPVSGIGLLGRALRRWALNPRFGTPPPRLLRYAAERAIVVDARGARGVASTSPLPTFPKERGRHVDRLLFAGLDAEVPALRALRLLDSGLFDPAHYRTAYPDVAAQGMDEVEHYLEHGDVEGRAPSRLFNPRSYRAAVRGPALPTALEHFIAHRGTATPDLFSPTAMLEALHGLERSQLTWADRRRGQGKLVYEENTPLARTRPAFNGEVLFISPLNVASGLGTSARGYAKVLGRVGMNLRSQVWIEGFEHQRTVGKYDDDLPPSSGSVLVLHLNLDLISIKVEKISEIIASSAYVIGIFYWELMVLHPEWIPWLRQVDEVWCPSTFIRDALTAAAPVKSAIVRPWLDFTEAPSPHDTRVIKPYFLYIFDMGSGWGRKNPDGLVRAYIEEFNEGEGFELVLKVGHADADSPAWRQLIDLIAGRVDVRLVSDHLDALQVAALIAGALAYVSPHRSEGLGLTIIEAQALGTPVIVTPWGGARDFTGPDYTTSLPYKMVEVGSGNLPYIAGALWAEPQIDSLKSAMRAHVTAPRRSSEAVKSAGRLVRHMFGEANAVAARESLMRAIEAISA